jgi:hypothetical protein
MNAVFPSVAAFVMLLLAGCSEGPHYRIVSTRAHGGCDEVILARYWQRPTDVLGMAHQDRFEYFVAPLDDSGLGRAQRLERDEWQQSAHFFPIAGTDRYVRVLKGDSTSFWIVAPGSSERRKLYESESSKTTAWAVTRDGRRLLVVDGRGLRVIDSATGDDVERTSDHLLIEARQVIVGYFGAAGTWFVSDDLRHVVIATPDWVSKHRVSMTPEPVKLRVGAVEFVAGTDGLIYDRESAALAKFPLGLQMPGQPIRYRVEVEAAGTDDGHLRLVYVGVKETGERVVVVASPDLSSQHAGDVPFRNPDLFALAGVEFLPERNQVRLLECTQPLLRPGGRGHSPDYFIRTWSYGTGRVEVMSIGGAEVIRAVDRAKQR